MPVATEGMPADTWTDISTDISVDTRAIISIKERAFLMASKNTTQVLIDGKIYTMSGYESEEYLQRVAAWLNNKLAEIKGAEGYARMSLEMRCLLLNLNTADDYFKNKKKTA